MGIAADYTMLEIAFNRILKWTGRLLDDRFETVCAGCTRKTCDKCPVHGLNLAFDNAKLTKASIDEGNRERVEKKRSDRRRARKET